MTSLRAQVPAWQRGKVASWLVTVDHKRIGILYIGTSGLFFALSGFLALLIRTQLARPDGGVVTGDSYNEVVTMHGTGMVFFVVVPILAGLGNFLVPLMIGAPDMAFPRLECALVLALRLRRPCLLLLVPRSRRRRQHRLDGLSAALARARGTARTCGSSPSTS